VQGCHEGTSIIPREPILWEVKMRMIPSQFGFFLPCEAVFYFTITSTYSFLQSFTVVGFYYRSLHGPVAV
jgi:hypothetical protein